MVCLSKIRDLTAAKGMTQLQLADMLGITRQGLSNIIKKNSTSLELLERIANILGVHPGVFFDSEHKLSSSTTNNNIYRNRVEGDNYGHMGSGSMDADASALLVQLKQMREQLDQLQKTNQDLAQANASLVLKLTKNM